MINKAIYSSKLQESPSIAIADGFRTRVLADNGIFEGYDNLIDTIKALRSKDIYQQASIILTPNGFKQGKLYALKSLQNNSDFIFSGGGGSRKNENGEIVPVPAGTPKIDYSNGFPEIVMERAAQNILRNSEILSSQTITTNTQWYALSFYGTGNVTIIENEAITLYGIGFNERATKIFYSTGGMRNIIVTGSVKYAQLEPLNNAQYYNFSTTWIPTLAATASRPLSSLSLNNIPLNSSGTIYFEVYRQGRGSLFRMDDGSQTNSIRFFNTGYSGNTLESLMIKNNNSSNSGTTSIILSPIIKLALAYHSDGCEIYIDGSFYAMLNNLGEFSNSLNRIIFTTSESTVNRFKTLAYIPTSVDSGMLKKFTL